MSNVTVVEEKARRANLTPEQRAQEDLDGYIELCTGWSRYVTRPRGADELRR